MYLDTTWQSLYFLHSKYYFMILNLYDYDDLYIWFFLLLLILVQDVTYVFMRFSHLLPFYWALSRLVRLPGCEWGWNHRNSEEGSVCVGQVTLQVNLLHHHLCSRELESVSIVLLHKEPSRLPARSWTKHFYYTVLMQPKQQAQWRDCGLIAQGVLI